MIKKYYWYNDGESIVSSHNKPDACYIEKIVSTIGVPDSRAVTIKDYDGHIVYNNVDTIPLNNDLIEIYLMREAGKCNEYM
jgi:hypothetical protein